MQSGFFNLNNTDFELEPVEVYIYRKKRDASARGNFNSERGTYIITRIEQHHEAFVSDLREVQTFGDETLGYAAALDNIDGQGKLHYYAELLIVVDYSTFER